MSQYDEHVKFNKIAGTRRRLIYIADMLSDAQECLDRDDTNMANIIIYQAKEHLFTMEEVQEWVDKVEEEELDTMVEAYEAKS
mgnify:CR=1 FL=1|tara:strand:- start:2665 stop:2913 length:249 start_codon:yes stop_codon:yes gene_type:complete